METPEPIKSTEQTKPIETPESNESKKPEESTEPTGIKEKIIEELKKVEDPELSLDIYTLGLVYNVAVKDKDVEIKMTLTSPMCPFGPQIIAAVKESVKKLDLNEPKIDLVFDPPWEPSEEVRILLGLPG